MSERLMPVESRADKLRSPAGAVGGARAIALIGHTQCGMVNLMARKQALVQGPVEAKRLRPRYPRVAVAPTLCRVEDNRLYLLQE